MQTRGRSQQADATVATFEPTTAAATTPIEGGVFGAMQAAEDIYLAGGTAGSIQAGRDVNLEGSTVLRVAAGNDVWLRDSGLTVAVAGQDAHVKNAGAALFVAGRDLQPTNGGAALFWAGHDLAAAAAPVSVQVAGNAVRTDQPGSLLVAAREAYVKAETIGVVLAGKANIAPGSRVLVTISPDNLAGALVGLAFFLPVQLWRRLRGGRGDG